MIEGLDYESADRPVTDASGGSSPERTCVGCRARSQASELLRVVVGEVEGHMVLLPDPLRRAPGRGAHVHPRLECLDLAERRRAFPRALRVQGALDSTALRASIEALA